MAPAGVLCMGENAMLRFLAVLFVSVAFWVQPAKAVFYSYSEWAALPEGLRTIYMSGAFDSLVTFANTPAGARGAMHYRNCVRDAQMTNDQLASNILNYAKDKPALHTKRATVAMLDYLVAACGLPPKPD